MTLSGHPWIINKINQFKCVHKYGDYEKQNSFLKKIQFESPIFALCSKASWDTYNHSGWMDNFVRPFEKLDCRFRG